MVVSRQIQFEEGGWQGWPNVKEKGWDTKGLARFTKGRRQAAIAVVLEEEERRLSHGGANNGEEGGGGG